MGIFKDLWHKFVASNAKVDLLCANNIPEHVAVILDGNGRWAERQGLLRLMGYSEGLKRVREITLAAAEIGVKMLTYYTFSTENWRRSHEEVNYIMELPTKLLESDLQAFIDKNIKVEVIGFRQNLPENTCRALDGFIDKTKHNTGLQLNLAFNYGGRAEILAAAVKIAKQVASGQLEIEEINEDKLQNCLMTAELPDPDLLIRTGGELRLSNFLLWQIAYSELWFTKCLWPDFNKRRFLGAIAEFQQRSRRFGGV